MGTNRRYGCIKSKLDGSEYVWDTKMDKLPNEYSYVTVMPKILDQGTTYKCVCYALTSYLDWKVNRMQGDNVSYNFSIDKLYSIRSNKPQNGMSIKEALKYLKQTGLNGVKINGYAKVGSSELLKSALILNGPCVCGILVKDSDRDDFWNGSGMEGGHAVLIVGYNEDGFIIRNSWGSKWGEYGYYVYPYDKFSKIMELWTMY